MTDNPRALLDAYASEEARPLNPYMPDLEDCAGKAFTALRAVLDLHKPEEIEVPPDDPGGGWTIRLSCTECSHYVGSDPWPCPTVQAITSALEAS